MVRNYIKKTKKLSYDNEQLSLAIDNIKNGQSIKNTAKEYGIPRSTFQKKLKKSNDINSPSTKSNTLF